MRLFLAALLFATPLFGGVDEAVDDVIVPGYATFAEASAALADDARADCTPQALATPLAAAFDAWAPVGDIRLGPSEKLAPAIAFWPDPRGFTHKTLTALIAAEDRVVDDAAAFAGGSVAGRGLFALEMLLFDPAFDAYTPQSYTCRLVRRITDDMAAQADALAKEWSTVYAKRLKTAGAPGNADFRTPQEARRAIYTQILVSLEFTRDKRLGRPLGTFEKPRPRRAAARRSGQSLAIVINATDGAVALAQALADTDLPETRTAFDRVHAAARKITNPAFADITDPSARFRLEVLQQKVDGVETAIETELGLPLGLKPGFNSQDGD